MDGVRANQVNVQIFELEGGGGGKHPALPEVLQKKLDRVKTQDPDFQHGVQCGLDFYRALPAEVKQSLVTVNVEANCLAIIKGITCYQIGTDLKEVIETRRKIANFKKGFSESIDSIKEIAVREQHELQESTLHSAYHLETALQALLNRMLKEATNVNPCYIEGIKSGFDYYRHMPHEDQPRLKSSDLERIFDELVSSLPLDRLVGETEDKLENFKRGFCKGLGEIIKERGQGGFLIGKSAAEAYYKDPVNRDNLKELYKDRAKLRGAFNTYAIKNKLDLKFSSRIGVANGGELNLLNTKKFEECYQGFMSTLESLLKKDEKKFKALDLSVEELAKQFDEPAAAVKMPKKTKNKKEKEPKIGEQNISPIKVKKEPPKQKELPEVKELPQKESADQKRAKIAQKRIEEFKNAENKQELLQMQKEKLARMQSHPATLKEALEIENNILEEFEKILAKMVVPNPRRKGRYAKKEPVKQETAGPNLEITQMPLEKEGLSGDICSMLVRLGLTNKYGNPFEFNHSYSQEQIQTLKVCVLHMIKSRMLLGRDPFTLQYSEKMLVTRLPDNYYTPLPLYGLLAYGHLDVLDVLEKAGF